uniref:(California timema) hypothetical protein n=1 Tax=Timema californicum TaxID=61474 RepID=A0A7R9PB98_TIMCA|nr:unnamed protein product [Timema californicum]
MILTSLIDRRIISHHSSITFIDDGSKDMTWSLISQASLQSSLIKGIKLSCNRGHQIALLAGLNESDADITISIDADLQDDTAVIEKMVSGYMEGYDIVYGVRNDRKTDSGFKRLTAEFFYKIMSWMGVKQIPNHADYRLLSRRALDALLEYKEQNLYIRGLVPLVGFKSKKVFYARAARLAGESKYPLKKMLGLAIEGITSLTVTPLRTIAALGFSISFISVFAALYALFEKFSGNTVEGWTSSDPETNSGKSTGTNLRACMNNVATDECTHLHHSFPLRVCNQYLRTSATRIASLFSMSSSNNFLSRAFSSSITKVAHSRSFHAARFPSSDGTIRPRYWLSRDDWYERNGNFMISRDQSEIDAAINQFVSLSAPDVEARLVAI